LAGGGSVTNGPDGATAALIYGFSGIVFLKPKGVLSNYSPGTVTNYGMINGTGYDGVLMYFGGRVTNGASGASGALISGSSDGVDIRKMAGTIVNFGRIAVTGDDGIYLGAGGSVINGAPSATGAVISTTYAAGVRSLGGIVSNYGTIAGGRRQIKQAFFSSYKAAPSPTGPPVRRARWSPGTTALRRTSRPTSISPITARSWGQTAAASTWLAH